MKFIKSKASRVILSIFDLIDDLYLIRSHGSLSLQMGTGQARSYLNEIERMRHGKAAKVFSKLQSDGYLENQKIGNNVITLLSKSGIAAALELRMVQNRSKMITDRVCVVAFDFPEAARVARRRFRTVLRRVGFRCEQRSVWITDHDVAREFAELVCLLGVEKWVRIFISKQVIITAKNRI